jgi:glucose/arabinose dehydrogenase
MYAIEEGAHYGWPYCYQSEGAKVFDTSRTWEREPIDCADSPLYFSEFDAHAAPLGFAHFASGSHETLENSFLVALQGSWDPEIGTGYQVMRVAMDGSQEVFIDGFQAEDGERIGRPVDILPASPRSFFLTDDFNGRMYYVYAK